MSDQDEWTNKFCTMVSDRLRKLHPNYDSADESTPRVPFRHVDMIIDMQAKARHHDREFLGDVLRLVGIYWKYGSNNTMRILEDFDGTPELKQRLIQMIDVYDIMDKALYYQPNPTLSRIAEAFPQISLVMTGEINANPTMGLKLWVSDRDLGSRVHYLFKLSCFPAMLYVNSSVKAEACLLLFNLCHARGIANMHTTNKNIVSAFCQSCMFSSSIMEQRLVSLESRLKFTEYIEEIAPSAELMYRIWTSVVGEQHIPLKEVTAVTLLHEKVLRSQPLYLVTWKKLLAEQK